jgi:hypothetical protein
MARDMNKQYKTVSQLPANAVKVSEYARQQNCHHSLIYHNITRGKATYKIVIFQGINFVIPD